MLGFVLCRRQIALVAGLLFQAFFRVAGLGGDESGPGTSGLLLPVGSVPAAWPAQAGNGPPLPALAWLYRGTDGARRR